MLAEKRGEEQCRHKTILYAFHGDRYRNIDTDVIFRRGLLKCMLVLTEEKYINIERSKSRGF